MTGRLRSANNYKHLIFLCGHATYQQLSLAAFYGPLAELEKLGPQTGPLFKLPSLVQGHVIVANCSRQELDSVSQTLVRESAGPPSQYLNYVLKTPNNILYTM